MMEQYSTTEALGYMIIALEKLEKSKKEIKEIIGVVAEGMDEWTEVHADQVHDRFYGI